MCSTRQTMLQNTANILETLTLECVSKIQKKDKKVMLMTTLLPRPPAWSAQLMNNSFM